MIAAYEPRLGNFYYATARSKAEEIQNQDISKYQGGIYFVSVIGPVIQYTGTKY